MCFIWLNVFTRTPWLVSSVRLCVICLKSLTVCVCVSVCVVAHLYLCMQLVWPVCACLCVALYSLGQQTLLSVCRPWVYGTGGSFMWPRLGEGLSGQGAWSQGSHTAAHCPELRAASQRRGGLVFLPQLWESVSRPGGGSPKWPPRERQDLCPRWCSCGAAA